MCALPPPLLPVCVLGEVEEEPERRRPLSQGSAPPAVRRRLHRSFVCVRLLSLSLSSTPGPVAAAAGGCGGGGRRGIERNSRFSKAEERAERRGRTRKEGRRRHTDPWRRDSEGNCSVVARSIQIR